MERRRRSPHRADWCGGKGHGTGQSRQGVRRERSSGGDGLRTGRLVAAAALVNVDRLTVKDFKNENVNDPPATGLPASSGAPPVEDAAALVGWGTRMLGDGHSLEWHRQCLAENGADTYRWAIEATCRAQAKGKVSKPGAYFTSLLRRRRGSGAAGATQAPPAWPAAGGFGAGSSRCSNARFRV